MEINWFSKRIYEHKRSIKLNDDRNAPFSYVLNLKNTFNFSQTTLTKPLHCKKPKKTNKKQKKKKTADYSNLQSFPKKPNLISPYLADIKLHEKYIKIQNG